MRPIHFQVPRIDGPAGLCWKQFAGTVPPAGVDALEHCTKPAGHPPPCTFEDQTEIARRKILSALELAGIGLESSHVRVALLTIYVDEMRKREALW